MKMSPSAEETPGISYWDGHGSFPQYPGMPPGCGDELKGMFLALLRPWD